MVFWLIFILAIYMLAGFVCSCTERLVHPQHPTYKNPLMNAINWIIWLTLWPVLLFVVALIRFMKG